MSGEDVHPPGSGEVKEQCALCEYQYCSVVLFWGMTKGLCGERVCVCVFNINVRLFFFFILTKYPLFDHQ